MIKTSLDVTFIKSTGDMIILKFEIPEYCLEKLMSFDTNIKISTIEYTKDFYIPLVLEKNNNTKINIGKLNNNLIQSSLESVIKVINHLESLDISQSSVKNFTPNSRITITKWSGTIKDFEKLKIFLCEKGTPIEMRLIGYKLREILNPF